MTLSLNPAENPAFDELRRLDFAVAQQVFDRDPLSARYDPTSHNGEPQYHWGYPLGHDFVPCYSTDIAAAMMVVEKMRERFSVDMESHEHPTREWQVKLWASGDIHGDERDESLSLAICRAALAATTTPNSQPEEE